MDILSTYVFIDLSHNFDIMADVSAEFDEALFTMALTEFDTDESREYYSEEAAL